MGHGHTHGPGPKDMPIAARRRDQRKRLAVVLGLVTCYMVAEVVGGLVTNSLALLADAGHMLSDAGALGAIRVSAGSHTGPSTPSDRPAGGTGSAEGFPSGRARPETARGAVTWRVG